MTRLHPWSDLSAARVAQIGSTVAVAAVVGLAARASSRSGATEVELLIGLLSASGLAVSTVALGTVTAIHEEIRRR